MQKTVFLFHKLQQIVDSHKVERTEILVHVTLYAAKDNLFRVNSKPLKVCIEEAAGCKGAGLLPDVSAASCNNPVLALRGKGVEGFTLLVLMEPLFPAMAVLNLLEEDFLHVGEYGYAAFCVVLFLKLLKFAEGAVF